MNQWLDEKPFIKQAGLSTEATKYLFEMSQQHVNHERPSWDNVFLSIAKEIAKRSPDAQTGVGAVIVDKHKHILGVGYNGWMPGIDDSLIPNIRPMKHEWVIHAELNAILNCEHRPRGATLYVTHQPCLNCFHAIVTSGLSEIVYIYNSDTTNTNGKHAQWEVAKFLTRNQIRVRPVEYMKG